ncbi:hypothetical protein E4K72_21960 [Oxalobacteraceae bacterium OM1]|nr:hypothetical protein E4K72_21960 [Oxalobacteraceae bacterium OM1]
MLLQVETRAGPHGDPEPISFTLGSQHITVLDLIDRWIAADHSYYKIAASDGDTYILRFDPAAQQWQLTLFQSSRHGA